MPPILLPAVGTASSESDLFRGKINMQLSMVNSLSQNHCDILSDMPTKHEICPHVTHDTVYSDMFPLGSYCTENLQILSRLKK